MTSGLFIYSLFTKTVTIKDRFIQLFEFFRIFAIR